MSSPPTSLSRALHRASASGMMANDFESGDLPEELMAEVNHSAPIKIKTPEESNLGANLGLPTHWPQFETSDIHKVNVADHTRSAHHLFDSAKDNLSVWEHILKGEQHQRDRASPKVSTTVSTSPKAVITPAAPARTDNAPKPITKTGGTVTSLLEKASTFNRAAVPLEEADTSMDTFKDVLVHYGSE